MDPAIPRIRGHSEAEKNDSGTGQNAEGPFKSRGRFEKRTVEKTDSGFCSDRSVSPTSHHPSAKQRFATDWLSSGGADSVKEESSQKIPRNHVKLQRTASVYGPVNTPLHHSRKGEGMGEAVPVRRALSVNSEKSRELVGNFNRGKTPNRSFDEESGDSEQSSFESMETLPGLKDDYASTVSKISSGSDDSDSEKHQDSVVAQPTHSCYVSAINETKQKLKKRYEEKLQYIFIRKEKYSSLSLLDDVYVKPCITEEEEEEEEEQQQQHPDMTKAKATPRRPRVKEFPNKWNIFEEPFERLMKTKTVLTKGIAGIGKTVCVQKFVLDWAKGKANQDIDVVLVLPLQDLHQNTGKRISLTELLQHFFPEIKQINLDAVRVLLILEGLDEYRLPLDFHHNNNWTDTSMPTTVDILLTNLIKGNLIPSALFWITSRPGSVNRIPPEYIQKFTEIQGFKDAQKEEYFHKRLCPDTRASKSISNIKKSRIFNSMCHIPAYCSLLATVLQQSPDRTDVPLTLAQRLTCLLLMELQSKPAEAEVAAEAEVEAEVKDEVEAEDEDKDEVEAENEDEVEAEDKDEDEDKDEVEA